VGGPNERVVHTLPYDAVLLAVGGREPRRLRTPSSSRLTPSAPTAASSPDVGDIGRLAFICPTVHLAAAV
jgi:hypothetical protein